MKTYTQLEERFKEISILADVSGILHWDAEVIMPVASNDDRGEQLAFLAALKHEKLVDPVLEEQVEIAVSKSNELDDWQQANLIEMRRSIMREKAVPSELVSSIARATNNCSMVWRQARGQNDFKMLEPCLAEVINLTKQFAQAKAEYMNCSLYDALLDEYDPARTTEEIDPLFASLQDMLPILAQEIMEKQKHLKVVTNWPCAVGVQNQLGVEFMKEMGFDFDKGRLDISTHPFCGGSKSDIRITTRYDENNCLTGIAGIMHETGHALYELNQPQQYRYQPVGSALGMSLHESQSLFVEKQLCNSRSFAKYLVAKLNKVLSLDASTWSAENLYTSMCRVQPSFIRVDENEVYYPLHIVLRYQLEKALINGEMQVSDIPSAWNEMMQKLIGITPPNDSLGCLQDIHWPSGNFGYFPTYTLGAMIAAQLAHYMKKDMGINYEHNIESGNFKPIISWLSDKVHKYASFHHKADELLKVSLGEKLNPQYFLAYLRDKYIYTR